MLRLQLAKIGRYNQEVNQPEITEVMLREMVETAIDSIPVIKGHYALSGSPASGWIDPKSLVAEDYKGVFSILGDAILGKELLASYKSGEFKHWSIGAAPCADSGGKWKLFHLGFLGAKLPAIPGLEEIKSIKASYGADDIKYFTFSFNENANEKTKDMTMGINLEKIIMELELELKTANGSIENSKSKELELQSEINALDEKNKALVVEKNTLQGIVNEHATVEFSTLLANLEKEISGKIPAGDAKSIIAEYKTRGIECKMEVESQIRIFKMVKTIVPGESIINNDGERKTSEEVDKEREHYNHPGGM